jgi:glycosyltransferase involved in cell wall biosynthesis
VPYGIPIAHIPAKLSPRDPGLIRFLLLGSYEQRKGQDLFLRAIKQLRSVTAARGIFEMAGRVLDRSFHETLRNQSAPLPHVRLSGALDHGQALAASAAAEVLVCASRDETMPIAILEAMSLGKAIVTTNVGGVAEWLRDGVNALVVPPEDHCALGEALRRCMDEEGLVESLGANARRTFFKHFSIDRLGERFSALLEQARKQKGP